MKILITGSDGLLARDCSDVLSACHDVVEKNSSELDITDTEQLEGQLRNINPGVVLNCAAFTNVEKCETEKERAYSVNVIGTGNIARYSFQIGAKLIHISTDYVFDGLKELPEQYNELDTAKPLSTYGTTKLQGENEIRSLNGNFLIVRTSWLYGIHSSCFPKTILKLVLNSENNINIVNDQFGSPTWTFELANQIKTLIDNNCTGLYHATSEGFCSWYEFAYYFLSKMNIKFYIDACTTNEYPTRAKRPENSVLANKRLTDEDLLNMSDWKKQVDNFIDKYLDELIYECNA